METARRLFWMCWHCYTEQPYDPDSKRPPCCHRCGESMCLWEEKPVVFGGPAAAKEGHSCD